MYRSELLVAQSSNVEASGVLHKKVRFAVVFTTLFLTGGRKAVANYVIEYMGKKEASMGLTQELPAESRVS